jgi:hypothetical protein
MKIAQTVKSIETLEELNNHPDLMATFPHSSIEIGAYCFEIVDYAFYDEKEDESASCYTCETNGEVLAICSSIEDCYRYAVYKYNQFYKESLLQGEEKNTETTCVVI